MVVKDLPFRQTSAHGNTVIQSSPQGVPLFGQTFLRREQIQVSARPSIQVLIEPEGKAQKIQAFSCLTQVNDPDLISVDFQTHAVNVIDRPVRVQINGLPDQV
jgi:hypothetical protein